MFRNRKMESERPKQEQEQLSLPSAFEKGWKTNRLQKLSSSQIFSKHTLRGETEMKCSSKISQLRLHTPFQLFDACVFIFK